MIEIFWLGVVFILFYLAVGAFGVDTRDGDDWFRHDG